MTLLYCSESSGSFITSDNPAFMFLSNVTKNNRNGLYLPLTPHHLLLIGKGTDDIENVDMYGLTNKGVRLYNNIILNKAKNEIISMCKHLGYIL